MRALADRMLGGRRHRPIGGRIDDRRAIADGPDALNARKRERRVRCRPAARVPGRRDAGDQRIRGVADGADDSGSRDGSAVVELDPIDVDASDAAAETEVDMRGAQLLGRVSTESLAELRQNDRLAVDENDARLEDNVAEAPSGELDEVLQLRGHLDPSRTATDDH